MVERQLQDHILALVRERDASKSICPSEVARELYPEDWRMHMDDVREAARVLAKAGHIRITQGDCELDPEAAWKGPIRLRMPDSSQGKSIL